MPVTVKTFATLPEAAAALPSDRSARYIGGTPVMPGAQRRRRLDRSDRAP
jgi:hypothetical protein